MTTLTRCIQILSDNLFQSSQLNNTETKYNTNIKIFAIYVQPVQSIKKIPWIVSSRLFYYACDVADDDFSSGGPYAPPWKSFEMTIACVAFYDRRILYFDSFFEKAKIKWRRNKIVSHIKSRYQFVISRVAYLGAQYTMLESSYRLTTNICSKFFAIT